ncbi:hypothetical protein H311_02864, partial [Anncaliia algerae PRA109]
MTSKNIIQSPINVSIEDLPEEIIINKKFKIKDEYYICELGDPSSSYICRDDSID